MTRKLVCAKPFDPAVFMGESWSAAEEDERADRLPEIDVSAIALVNCLKNQDQLPTGEFCVKLLKDISDCGRTRASFGQLEGAATLCSSTAYPEPPQRQPLFALSPGTRINGIVSAWLGNTRSATSPSAVLAMTILGSAPSGSAP
jgi:hypothetical protein